MNRNKEISTDDDKNRRDRETKHDRKEIREFTVQQQKRGELKVTGKHQAARSKESGGQRERSS